LDSPSEINLSIYNPETDGPLVLSERYELTSFLNQGGMGRLYLANDRVLNRTVVVKILLPQFLDNEKFVRRFQREAQTLSKINHPHLLTVYDFGIFRVHYPYIVTEFVRGDTLSDMIDREGRIPLGETVEILSQVCDGLHAAHQQGITHRDMKPDNILVSREAQQEWIKVIDFGLAVDAPEEKTRLTDPGSLIGTAAYMAPEQFERSGADVDARTDVYAVGVIFYEMLTGTLPYSGETIHNYCLKHMQEPIPDLADCIPQIEGYVPELQDVLEKALAKKPADRYQTTAAFKRDLRLAVGAQLSDATLPIPARRRTSSIAAQPAPAPVKSGWFERFFEGTRHHHHRVLYLTLGLLAAFVTAAGTLMVDRVMSRNVPSAEITSLFTQGNVTSSAFPGTSALRVGIRGTANNYQNGNLKMEIRVVDLKGRAVPIIEPKDGAKDTQWRQFEKENGNFGYTFDLQPDDKSYSIFKTLELPYFLFAPQDSREPLTFVVSARLLTPKLESLAIRDSDFIEAPRDIQSSPPVGSSAVP